MLSNFRWYRRMIGGKWATVCGWFWGRRWVHLPDTCIEQVEEDWVNDVATKRDLRQMTEFWQAEKRLRCERQQMLFEIMSIVDAARGDSAARGTGSTWDDIVDRVRELAKHAPPPPAPKQWHAPRHG